MFDFKKAKFDELFNSEYGTTTAYFMAPKEWIKLLDPNNKYYDESVWMEISVEFPSDHPEANLATICWSPTINEGNEDDMYFSDVDWNDWCLAYEDIEKLMELIKV